MLLLLRSLFCNYLQAECGEEVGEVLLGALEIKLLLIC